MSDDDVPVSALLGAAYEAVVHGQGLAAREAVELVKDLGFERNGTAKPFRFAYQHTEATEDGPQVRTVHATVPLLSLINPPSISIDSAKISMSLHLISQDIETGPTDPPIASGGTPAAAKMPKLRGRIVHQSDKNAVMTIESTLKQRDLLASSRLSQLLDAAVSDRDSVWYQVLERAELFRAAATALIDTVAQDASKGKSVGVREWLQQLWELKEAVTDAVSAFRDGLPEKIPPLHQRWNTQCGNLTWIDRHTEPEEMAALRRAFIAAASNVWQALLPGAQVAEFGPPTVEQLRLRFEAAVSALAATATGLEGLPEQLRHLEAAVAQGCIAHQYKQPEAVKATLQRYNQTAATIREMWKPIAQSRESRAKQDKLAAAATTVWDALAREVPGDFRTESRMSAEEIKELLDKCDRLLNELGEQKKKFTKNGKDSPSHPLRIAYELAEQLRSYHKADWDARKWNPDENAKEIASRFDKFNLKIQEVNRKFPTPGRFTWLTPETWNAAAPAWNEKARQFWGHLLDIRHHPVTDVADMKPNP
ncbi:MULTISPECIES: DUF2589 domain-containing protein [unclassified Streptomyces]|uniref:DUF2589 domain-containing protein n=1 Tax=unclassified Streptomyces TaxID=2593676 RepID=UPI00382A7193